jgi:hypothetical protein
MSGGVKVKTFGLICSGTFLDICRVHFNNMKFLVPWGGGWDRVHLVRRPLLGLLYQPRMIDEHLAFGGMRIGKENRSTRRKPAPVPHCPPQISHKLTWARTRAPAIGSQRLTAWAMAQSITIWTEISRCMGQSSFPGGTAGKKLKNPQSGQKKFRPKFEPSTLRIQL